MAGKRILITTGDAGFGHRSAAEAIAAALAERHGGEVEVFNPMDDDRVPKALREGQHAYDDVVQDLPRLYKMAYDSSDATVPASVLDVALTVALFGVVRDRLRNYDPDAVVTTFPLFPAVIGAVRTIEGGQTPLITVVTDLTETHRIWYSQASDLTVVPTGEARQVALDHGLAADRVEVIGIPVDPAFAGERRAPAAIRGELGWDPDLTTLLVVGSRRVRDMGGFLRMLNHAGLPLQLAIVAGGDDALYAELQEIEWHGPTHTYNFVENMPALMRASDLILCKAGGLIVTEALACGLPLLLIDVLPGQEEGNAEYVVEHGAGELAEKPMDALAILYHWLEDDGQLLAERAGNARQIGRPQAAYEIAERVWHADEELASAEADQAEERSKLSELLSRYDVPWQS